MQCYFGKYSDMLNKYSCIWGQLQWYLVHSADFKEQSATLEKSATLGGAECNFVGAERDFRAECSFEWSRVKNWNIS